MGDHGAAGGNASSSWSVQPWGRRGRRLRVWSCQQLLKPQWSILIFVKAILAFKYYYVLPLPIIPKDKTSTCAWFCSIVACEDHHRCTEDQSQTLEVSALLSKNFVPLLLAAAATQREANAAAATAVTTLTCDTFIFNLSYRSIPAAVSQCVL